jgi:hypothetical protein
LPSPTRNWYSGPVGLLRMLFVSIIGIAAPAGRPLYPWPDGYRGGGGRTLEDAVSHCAPSPWRKPAPGCRHLLSSHLSDIQHSGYRAVASNTTWPARVRSDARGPVDTAPRSIGRPRKVALSAGGLQTLRTAGETWTSGDTDAVRYRIAGTNITNVVRNRWRSARTGAVTSNGQGQGPRERRQGYRPARCESGSTGDQRHDGSVWGKEQRPILTANSSSTIVESWNILS